MGKRGNRGSRGKDGGEVSLKEKKPSYYHFFICRGFIWAERYWQLSIVTTESRLT